MKRNKSTTYSKKLIQQVAKLTKQISEEPYVFKSTDFKNTRVATLAHFCLFYKVTSNEIIITAFWDNRQDFKKLHNILKS